MEKTQRWRQAREIYTAALERPTGERPAFLDQRCGSDLELRQEVELLLRATVPSGTYVEQEGRVRRQLPFDPADPASARSLGKYEILEQIGQGGFGVVYKGRDPILQREVAIKTCSHEDSELRRRFFREGRIAAALQHPNVTTVHDLGLEGDMPYLVQEFLSGEDLTALMTRGTLGIETKLDYLIQIARGLGYAHSQGVLHRDVKPANVRVLDSGVIKIMDFGIARLLSQETRLTVTGAAIGTAGYLAPEQLQGTEVDTRADVFAFGVLAYELFSGRRPFEADTFARVCYRLLNEDPPPLGTVWPDCPDPRLVTIVERCLVKDPAGRYPSMAAVEADLEAVLAALRSGETPVSGWEPTIDLRPGAVTQATRVAAPPSPHPAVSSGVPAPGPRRWRRVAGMAAVVVALVAVAAIAWWWGLSQGARQAPPVGAETAQLPPAVREPVAEPSAAGARAEPAPEPEEPPAVSRPAAEPSGEEPAPADAGVEQPAGNQAAVEAPSDPAEEGPAMQFGDLIPAPPPGAAPPPGVVRPQVIEQARPQYPRAARRLRRQVRVWVLVLVDEYGKVIDARLPRADRSGLGFGKAALEAARKTRFRPATRDGIAGKMWTNILFKFGPNR